MRRSWIDNRPTNEIYDCQTAHSYRRDGRRNRALFPRYPTKQAVTLPALHIVNEKLRYVPLEAVVEIAELLELAPAVVQDTLSFYGMFKQD